MRNIKVSPISIAAMAPDRAYGAGNTPRALAPPAISKASAAGTGNPIASSNTAANRITKPCAARFEIQESMTVQAVLWSETSDCASLRLYRQRLYGSNITPSGLGVDSSVATTIEAAVAKVSKREHFFH